MNGIDVVRYALNGDVAVITVDNPPVNALSAAVRAGIQAAMDRLENDSLAKAAILVCAGRTFIAGADITEFDKPPKSPDVPTTIDIIERSSKPVVSAIHGTALGGGLETAMASHWRVAVPSAKFGLPELKLGVLPGAGGTQRLPRLVGVENALNMITSGATIDVRTALDRGLIDGIVDGDLQEGAIAFARRVIAENRPLRLVRNFEEKIAAARGKPQIFTAFRKANAKRFRGFEAPEACIQAIEAAVNLPFQEGLQRERELFTGLVTGDQSKAQRHIFFAERQLTKIADIPSNTATLPITKIGVIGAGTMGAGIAMVFLNAELPVTIVDVNPETLDRGISAIRRNYESMAKKGQLDENDIEQRMGLLEPSIDMRAVAGCDLVIEAAFELMDIKKEIFVELDSIAKDGAILATNTSYLDVNEIAGVTKRPESVLGMHFFSPAHIMRLLEVARGAKTSKEAVATAMKLGKKLGKVAVPVGVCRGFVGNRMLATRQREAQKLIIEGAMPWDVDRVLYDFGFPMGPFAMADLAGLDLGWRRETSTGSTIREILNEMGRRGQKTGAGFYDYDENRKATPSPVVEKTILDFAVKRGISRRILSDREILERCLYPMINEGAKILDEGIAQRPGDIDIVWIYGYGWPAYRGGPMWWADSVGAKTIAERMTDFQFRLGGEFRLAPLLERLAADGGRFVT